MSPKWPTRPPVIESSAEAADSATSFDPEVEFEKEIEKFLSERSETPIPPRPSPE